MIPVLISPWGDCEEIVKCMCSDCEVTVRCLHAFAPPDSHVMENPTRGSHFCLRTSTNALPRTAVISWRTLRKDHTSDRAPPPTLCPAQQSPHGDTHTRIILLPAHLHPRSAPPNSHFMKNPTRGSHFCPRTSTHILPRPTITSWRTPHEDHTSARAPPPTLCPAQQPLHG